MWMSNEKWVGSNELLVPSTELGQWMAGIGGRPHASRNDKTLLGATRTGKLPRLSGAWTGHPRVHFHFCTAGLVRITLASIGVSV
jgi:hypothetical protein